MKLLLTTFSLLFTLSLTGQRMTVSGTVKDKISTLPGATVFLLHQEKNNEIVKATNARGTFLFERLKPGEYTLRVTFVGYDEYKVTFTLTNKDKNFDNIFLEEQAVDLEGVTVKDKAVLGIQDGDTTNFNANAFKVNPDASAEDLVRKMPGGVVIQDGQVQAQGENVQQVLVDGRRFFGNDPSAALKTLPAEAVEKIQVFDAQSEQAQFTGFEDGQTTKTINIVTKKNMRNGQFGKVYAGYGYEDKYRAGANNNFFAGNRRISIIAQANNINQQNFATDDLLGVVGSGGRRGGRGGGRGRGGRGGGGTNDFMVRQQGGITETQALGINYSDKWGKKVEISGSYFFNRSDNNSVQNTNRAFVDNENVSEVYTEYGEVNSVNMNHRINARLEYKINDNNSIFMRPRLSMQFNNGTDSTFGQTMLGNDLLNLANNDFASNLQAINFSNNFLFRHRFAKRRRSLSIGVTGSYNQNAGESWLTSENQFFLMNPLADTLEQFSDLVTDGWSVNTNVSYTEPITKKVSLMLTYRNSFGQEQSNKETFDYSPETQSFSIPNGFLTNTFDNNTLSHSGRVGMNYRIGKTFIMASVTTQYSEINNDVTFPNPDVVEKSFFNVLPFVMIRTGKSRSNNLRIFYRTNTQNPSVTQLQDVVDNSNPLQLSIGNPDLEQSYQHSLFFRYSKTNAEKSSVFYALVGGGVTSNYITNSTYLVRRNDPIFRRLNVNPGAQLTQPVNLDGYVNGRIYLTYGIPLSKIKSNINFDVTTNYARIPGLINRRPNMSNNMSYGLGITLSSNISENVDFTLSSRSTRNDVTNSLQANLNTNYFNQRSTAKINFIFGKGIVLRSDLNHQYYAGLSEGFNQNYILWNAAVGKKIGKNQRGEFNLTLFDILNQNRSIQRNVTDIYIEDVYTQVLQRYVMLSYVYTIRNFGQAPERSDRDRDRDRGERPPFGPPPGGPPRH